MRVFYVYIQINGFTKTRVSSIQQQAVNLMFSIHSTLSAPGLWTVSLPIHRFHSIMVMNECIIVIENIENHSFTLSYLVLGRLSVTCHCLLLSAGVSVWRTTSTMSSSFPAAYYTSYMAGRGRRKAMIVQSITARGVMVTAVDSVLYTVKVLILTLLYIKIEACFLIECLAPFIVWKYVSSASTVLLDVWATLAYLRFENKGNFPLSHWKYSHLWSHFWHFPSMWSTKICAPFFTKSLR